MKQVYSLLALVVVLAFVLLLSGVFPKQAVQTETRPPLGAVLTKEEAIARQLYTLPDAEVLEAKLLYHEEAHHAVGLKGINYEIEPYKKDDPVWVVALKSDNLDQMPFLGDCCQGVIFISNAVDGMGSSMTGIRELSGSEKLARLRALPDRYGESEIIPRERPGPINPPPTDAPTPTSIPTAITAPGVDPP